jgi:hypothetical protein
MKFFREFRAHPKRTSVIVYSQMFKLTVDVTRIRDVMWRFIASRRGLWWVALFCRHLFRSGKRSYHHCINWQGLIILHPSSHQHIPSHMTRYATHTHWGLVRYAGTTLILTFNLKLMLKAFCGPCCSNNGGIDYAAKPLVRQYRSVGLNWLHAAECSQWNVVVCCCGQMVTLGKLPGRKLSKCPVVHCHWRSLRQ